MREVDGWRRDVWRFMYRMRLESLHWDVLEQDRVMLEALARDARDRESLYQHDVGLARIRRWMMKEAERQVAALAEAKSPPTNEGRPPTGGQPGPEGRPVPEDRPAPASAVSPWR